MSLQSGLDNLENLARLGITSAAAGEIRQCLDANVPDAALCASLDQAPVATAMMLQLASTSYYSSGRHVHSMPMALHLLGVDFSRQYLHGLLQSMPICEEPPGVPALRKRLEQARLNIMESSGQGDAMLIKCLLKLCELVPLYRHQAHQNPLLPDWRTWGQLLREQLGSSAFSPVIHGLFEDFSCSPAEVKDPDRALNLALMQLILGIATGNGLASCDPHIWSLVDLHPQLLASRAVVEDYRG